jgi:hypothetical protein
MIATPAPAEGRRARPRVRRAQLREAETGLITRAAFAAQHGVSEVTVRAWCRRGLAYVKICGLIYLRVESARE